MLLFGFFLWKLTLDFSILVSFHPNSQSYQSVTTPIPGVQYSRRWRTWPMYSFVISVFSQISVQFPSVSPPTSPLVLRDQGWELGFWNGVVAANWPYVHQWNLSWIYIVWWKLYYAWFTSLLAGMCIYFLGSSITSDIAWINMENHGAMFKSFGFITLNQSVVIPSYDHEMTEMASLVM